MSSINVLNILVQNPTAKFKEDFKFEIVFECLSELKNGTYILTKTLNGKLYT